MTQQIPPFPLRLPQELRAWLDELAKENGRSLNSELVQRLKEIKMRESAKKERCMGE